MLASVCPIHSGRRVLVIALSGWLALEGAEVFISKRILGRNS